MFPFDTQAVEGDNSRIKRLCWIARAISFGRVAKKMTIRKSAPLTLQEFADLQFRAKECLKKEIPPFTTKRWETEPVESIPRLPPLICSHRPQGSPMLLKADAIANFIEKKWAFKDVLRIGDRFMMKTGSHYD